METEEVSGVAFDTSTLKDIAEGLRMERARLRLSRKSLSKRSGVSEGTIARAENFYPNVHLEILLRILHGLGVSPKDFFGAFE